MNVHTSSRRSLGSMHSKLTGPSSEMQDSALDEFLDDDEDSLSAKIRQTYKRVEEHLFNLLYLMTKDRKKMFNNRAANTALLVFDFLQFMFFVFSGDFPWYFKFNLTQTIFETFQLTAGALPEFVFVPIFFLICVALLSMVGLAVYVAKVSKRSHFEDIGLVIALRLMVAAFITLGYIPFLKVAIVPMDCSFTDKGIYLDAFPSVECFKGFHIPLFFLSLAVTVTFIPFALIMSLVYFDSHPKSPNYLSRATNRVDFVYTVCRTLVVLTSTFTTNLIGLRVSIIFVANVVMLTAYITYPPYHRQQPTCLRIAFFATGTLSSIFAVATVIINDPENWVLVTVLGVLILPVFVGSYIGAKKYVARISKLSDGGSLKRSKDPTSFRFKNPYMVELATRKYLRLREYAEVPPANIALVKTMYQRGMDQFKDSALLRVQYALFLIAYVPSSLTTEVKLLIVEMSKLRNVAFDVRFLIFNLRWVWQQDMETRGLGRKGGLDLIDYMYFKRNFAVAKHFHQEARRSLFSFWKLLLRPNISLPQLESQAEEFERVEQISISAYEKLLVKYFNSKDLLRSYGSFWLDIYRNTAVSNECFAMADEIEEYENKRTEMKAKRAVNAIQSDSESSADERKDERNENSAGENSGSEDEENKSRLMSEYTSSSGRERERLKKMKARLDKIRRQGGSSESKAVRRFTILLYTLQLFLFIVPLTGIIIFNQLYLSIWYNSHELQKMHDQMFQVQDIMYKVQSYSVISASNSVPGSKYYECEKNAACVKEYNELKADSPRTLSDFLKKRIDTYYMLTKQQKSIIKFWIEPSMQYSVFMGPPIAKMESLFALTDVGDFLVERARTIFSQQNVSLGVEDDVSLRFCIENGPDIATKGFMNAAKLHLDYEHHLIDQFTIHFSVLSAVAAVFVLITAIIWGPTYRIVVSEISSLAYLKTVKKQDLEHVCGLYRFVDKNEEDDNSNLHNEQAKRVNERSKFRRIIFLLITSLAMCGVIVVVYTGVYSSAEPLELANVASERAALSHLSQFLVRGILSTEGNITASSQEYALNVLEEIRRLNNKLAKSASGKSKQENSLFKSCPGISSSDAFSHVSEFISEQQDIIFKAPKLSYEERLKLAAELFSLQSVQTPLVKCLITSREYYEGQSESGEYNTLIATNIYFWIVWPCFFIITATALPIGFREQVISASIRSRRILQMLPQNIVQRNPKIYEYMIEKGLIEGTINEEERFLENQKMKKLQGKRKHHDKGKYSDSDSSDDETHSNDTSSKNEAASTDSSSKSSNRHPRSESNSSSDSESRSTTEKSKTHSSPPSPRPGSEHSEVSSTHDINQSRPMHDSDNHDTTSSRSSKQSSDSEHKERKAKKTKKAKKARHHSASSDESSSSSSSDESTHASATKKRHHKSKSMFSYGQQIMGSIFGMGNKVTRTIRAKDASGKARHMKKDGKDKKKAKLFQDKQCSACRKRERAVLFMPCGHLVLCAKCADGVRVCPNCSGSVQRKETIRIDS